MQFKLSIPYTKNKKIDTKLTISRYSDQSINEAKISSPKAKVFCIGFGKTGTTSLRYTLKELGYKLGEQSVAEILCEDVINGELERILKYVETADAFQDVPFSFPGFYQILDTYYPDSLFILTIRDNVNQWYRSLLRYHIKSFSTNPVRLPSETDLYNNLYRYKGWVVNLLKGYFNYPNIPLYDEKNYKKIYISHIKNVSNYFNMSPERLLIINLSETGSYKKLCNFLGIVDADDRPFPHLNKT